jgi:hypothetical protein
MQKSHSWFFYVCAIEGAVAIAALISIPSEGGSLSPARLALVGFIALIAIGCLYLGLRPLRERGSTQVNKYTRTHTTRLRVYLRRRGAMATFICVVAFLTLAIVIFLLRYFKPESSLSTYQRLSPLLWYLLVLSIQFSFFFLLTYLGFHPENLVSYQPIYLAALTAFSLLLLLFLFISNTRLGLTPDPAYWSEPGAPILGWGFALALLGGLGVLLLTFASRTKPLDVLLPVAIYLFAVVIWLSVPVDVLRNSFYMPIDPQTSQPFPYSDASYYDQMAQSLLIGHPYQGDIPTRPLYIFLLTVLHLLFGENYRNIIIGQTFVLALIPVIFYFLGKKLHSYVAGVVIALFFIFRELTTLLISSDTRVSNTKTLLVDLPTLLLLTLACYFAIRWLEQKDSKSALIAGGTFGLLLLLRTQSVIILPLILLAALLVFGWKSKSFYLLTSFFLLGLAITITPWLLHNYLQTGEFAFDATFQYATIASQYAYAGNLDINNYDFAGKGVGRILLDFALKDPAFVFGFISNHFLAAQVHSLLALPLFKPYYGIFEPINLYWMNGAGKLEWYNILLLIVYLGVIAFGLGSAWKRWRWIGLLPLAFSAGYALATAVGRFSGWRYDFPADWISYFYFGIGVAELMIQAALLFRAEPKEDVFSVGTQRRPDWRSRVEGSKRASSELIMIASLFAFMGALPWLAENISSPRYPDQSQAFLAEKLVSLSNAPSLEEIKTFVSQPDSFLQIGRVAYPRFFGKDDGLSSTNPWASYAIRDYARIGFLLLNQHSASVVFPSKRISNFPHAMDAIVLGCQRGDFVDARLVAFPELDAVYLSEPFTETCSP